MLSLIPGEAWKASLERNAEQQKPEKTGSVQGRGSGQVREAAAGKVDDGGAEEDLRPVNMTQMRTMT